MTTKVHLNSVISTPNAKYLTCDIKYYYYSTPLNRYEYLRMHITTIPHKIIDQYNVRKLMHNVNVYIEVRKGIPGLKQTGKIANERLKTHLAKFGYYPISHTSVLRISKTNNVTFTLCVDDFGMKYTNRAHAEHLLNALKKYTKFQLTGRFPST